MIERILKYTFVPSSPLVPSSDPFHLRGTTHLLLVSRAIRELALPFFYHTVNITRPSDYTTFFDPDNGLFVAGETGPRRWSLVRSLGLVYGVEPPVVSDPSLTQVPSGAALLVPLAFPTRHPRLPTFCLLRRRSTLTEWKLGLHRLQRLACLDPSRRYAIEDELYSAWENDPVDSDYPFEQVMIEQYGHDVDAQINEEISAVIRNAVKDERERVFQRLLVRIQPGEVHWAMNELYHYVRGLLKTTLPDTTLVVYSSWEGAAETVGSFVERVTRAEDMLGVAQVRSVGIPVSYLDEENPGSWKASFPPLPGTDEPSHIPPATWSWTTDTACFAITET